MGYYLSAFQLKRIMKEDQDGFDIKTMGKEDDEKVESTLYVEDVIELIYRHSERIVTKGQ